MGLTILVYLLNKYKNQNLKGYHLNKKHILKSL